MPKDTKCLGATDAAKPGMGGVYFLLDEGPCVWRYPFPDEVQRCLVSWENPKGDITNSDLEHTGELGQVLLLSSHTEELWDGRTVLGLG